MRKEVIQVGPGLRRHAGTKQHTVIVPLGDVQCDQPVWVIHVESVIVYVPSKTEQLGMPREKNGLANHVNMI